jgi:hypothetical protein
MYDVAHRDRARELSYELTDGVGLTLVQALEQRHDV